MACYPIKLPIVTEYEFLHDKRLQSGKVHAAKVDLQYVTPQLGGAKGKTSQMVGSRCKPSLGKISEELLGFFTPLRIPVRPIVGPVVIESKHESLQFLKKGREAGMIGQVWLRPTWEVANI